MNLLKNIFITCVLLFMPLSAVLADKIHEIVAFGDSLTDTGNYYALSGNTNPASPPYYNGHFSNGPVWVERLAWRLGIPAPVASSQGGTNYAYSDARTGGGVNTSQAGIVVPNIGSQISDYLTNHRPKANQLFVIWGGGNDFIYDFIYGSQTNPQVPVNNLKNHITALANAGAKNFVVGNLFLLGKTPLIINLYYGAYVQYFNAMSQDFNTKLDSMLCQLRSKLGINIYRLDAGSLFQNIQANPSAYGLVNAFDPAKSGDIGAPGVVAPNPNEYLFWDGVHPTAAAHHIIERQVSLDEKK
jgi:outer membrane lipase/esterase